MTTYKDYQNEKAYNEKLKNERKALQQKLQKQQQELINATYIKKLQKQFPKHQLTLKSDYVTLTTKTKNNYNLINTYNLTWTDDIYKTCETVIKTIDILEAFNNALLIDDNNITPSPIIETSAFRNGQITYRHYRKDNQWDSGKRLLQLTIQKDVITGSLKWETQFIDNSNEHTVSLSPQKQLTVYNSYDDFGENGFCIFLKHDFKTSVTKLKETLKNAFTIIHNSPFALKTTDSTTTVERKTHAL